MLRLITQGKRHEDVGLKLQIPRNNYLFYFRLFTNCVEEKKTKQNYNDLYGILKKETGTEESFVPYITEHSKALKVRELGFFFLFCLFLCFSLWAICK